MSASPDHEILNIEEAAQLLGVSVKTFNKVLHSENIPARKIGREWKFSRGALIQWVGEGRSMDFYREGAHAESRAGRSSGGGGDASRGSSGPERRTGGWQIEVE